MFDNIHVIPCSQFVIFEQPLSHSDPPKQTGEHVVELWNQMGFFFRPFVEILLFRFNVFFLFTCTEVDPAIRNDSLARPTIATKRGSLYSNLLPYTMEVMMLAVAQLSEVAVTKGFPKTEMLRV